MKILCINLPIERSFYYTMFPYNIASIAALLKEEFDDVSIIDLNENRMSFQELKYFFRQNKFDVICLSAMVTQYSFVKRFSFMVKSVSPETKIILGGVLATTCKGLIESKTCVDIVYDGVLNKNFIRMIKNNPSYNSNKRVVWCLPDFSSFNITKYSKNHNLGLKGNSLNIITSLGCSYNCIFCSSIFSKKVELKPIPVLIEEIKILMDDFRIKSFIFADELFLTDFEYVTNLFSSLRDNNISFPWAAYVRADSLDEKKAKFLATNRCKRLFVGFESASQKILDILRKGYKVEQMQKTVNLCKKYNISLISSFIIGSPNETEKDIKLTKKFCLDNNLYPVFNFFTPVPGTAIYKELIFNNKIKDEENHILSLEDFYSGIPLNLSRMSDDKLVDMKKEIEDECETNMKKMNFLKRFSYYYNYMGLKLFKEKIMEWFNII